MKLYTKQEKLNEGCKPLQEGPTNHIKSKYLPHLKDKVKMCYSASDLEEQGADLSSMSEEDIERVLDGTIYASDLNKMFGGYSFVDDDFGIVDHRTSAHRKTIAQRYNDKMDKIFKSAHTVNESYVEVDTIEVGEDTYRVVGGGFNTNDALVSVEDKEGNTKRLSSGDVVEFYTWYDKKGNVVHEPAELEESAKKSACNESSTFDKMSAKVLGESFVKALNEGPGAGYTVSGTLSDVTVNAIKDVKIIDRDSDLVTYEVELDATANFDDVSANSYYYGGTIDSTPVSIIRARVESIEGDLTNEDVKYAINGAHIKANLGGGWSHSTFDGFIDVDYMSIDNASELMGILFELTDKNAVAYLDRAVQNENTETQYGVVEGHWIEAAFDTKEEAIQFAKEQGYEAVQELYVLIDINGDEIDTEFGDMVWTAEEMEESLNEDKITLDDKDKEALKHVRDYRNHKYDLPDLHKNLEKVYGNKKIAVPRFAELDKISDADIDKILDESIKTPMNESISEEDRINALAEYLDIDPKEITATLYNAYETSDGEEYIIATADEAEEIAKENIRGLWDDLGLDSFTETFEQWILDNAIKSEWFEEWLEEDTRAYVDDIEYESGRLEDELLDAGIITQEELANGFDIDEAKDKYVDYLVEAHGDPIEFFRDNMGTAAFNEVVAQNNLVDIDVVVDEALSLDGVAHFIATYDGDEIELDNGLYAYRTN